MTGGERRDLGAFAVSAGPDEVAAFRQATGCVEGVGGSRVPPLTFPMRWLAQPDVRGALLAMVPEADLIPVHESQTFDYTRPLAVGETYTMTVAGRRETGPDRLIVDGVLASAEGAVVARLETILRLFSTRAIAA